MPRGPPRQMAPQRPQLRVQTSWWFAIKRSIPFVNMTTFTTAMLVALALLSTAVAAVTAVDGVSATPLRMFPNVSVTHHTVCSMPHARRIEATVGGITPVDTDTLLDWSCVAVVNGHAVLQLSSDVATTAVANNGHIDVSIPVVCLLSPLAACCQY